MKRKGIAIIGSVGIPNRYGGFESFVESIAPVLVRKGHKVTVTCDKKTYQDDLAPTYNSVDRVFIPVSANGAASPLHDLLAFLVVAWKVDNILILGVSGGIFFPFFRLLSTLFNAAPFAVNIDGVEWQRGKFGFLRKSILYIFDRISQKFSYGVIYDNAQLKRYVLRNKYSACIAYAGDHVIPKINDQVKQSAETSDYALTICRIEPENNCEMLIRGFLKSELSRYIFIGNWNASEYGRNLREHYCHEKRLDLRDPIYDKYQLHILRSSCAVYLHGHSVGGTNPSLVEMLFYETPILCFDVAYHRSTAGECAGYFSDEESLVRELQGEMTHSLVDRSKYRTRYSAKVITEQLILFLKRM